MLRSGTGGQRQRIYSLTALLVVTVVAIVILVLTRDMTLVRYQKKTYKEPYKVLLRLSEVQTRFFRGDHDEDGVRDYATSLDELGEAALITDRLRSGTVADYTYAVTRADTRGFEIQATPIGEITSASIHYYVDETQLIRAARGEPATRTSTIYYDALDGFTGNLGVHTPETDASASR